MNQSTLLQNIAKYLARFSEEVELLNNIGDFSINIHAENMLVTLLNMVYRLRNVNTTKKRMFQPSICWMKAREERLHSKSPA